MKAALAGRSGEDLGQEGIAYVEIGAEAPLYRSLAERRFVYSLAVRVHATVHTPDTDLVAFTEARVQYELADLHATAPAFDESNYVASGIAVDIAGTGLAADVSAGAAFVGGVAVAYAGEAMHVFAPDRWTYRDLTAAGALVFVAGLPRQPAPPVTAGALRVGVTVADSADVVADAYLAATMTQFNPGDPDRIVP